MTHHSKAYGILWDYDGVIVPSDDIKWRFAWEEAFKRENPALICCARGILATHEGRNISRGEVINNVLRIAQEQSVPTLHDRDYYLERFAKAVMRLIPEKGIIEGVEDALRTLQEWGVSQHIISGTRQEDLDHTTRALGVDRYVRSIRGGTGKDKVPHAREIMAEEPTVTRWVVVGDQWGDYELAQEVGAEFIAVLSKYNDWTARGEPTFPVLSSAKDVPEVIQKLVLS